MSLKAEIRGVLTGLAAVAVVLLLAISLRPVIPGQELLSSLRFHVGIALLALPVLLALFGAWFRAAAMGALIVLSLGQGAWTVMKQLNTRSVMAAQTPVASFTLLSFNVLAYNTEGAEIAAYMTRTAPDVAVILETPGIERQLGQLSATFPYRAGCTAAATCDLSLFSRTPLRDVQVFKTVSSGGERLIVAKTSIDGLDVTIVAAHLTKPYFDESAGADLLQVRAVLKTITGPVVLAGDFNAAAWSRNIAGFVARNGLVPPPRFPATWPVELGPLGVPIDNMFSRDGALIQSISALDSSIGSNHRGLLAQVGIMAPQDVSPSP